MGMGMGIMWVKMSLVLGDVLMFVFSPEERLRVWDLDPVRRVEGCQRLRAGEREKLR
jgi:hypothetical protein